MPTFSIPEDLSVFTPSYLTQLSDTAVAEYNSLYSSMQTDPALQTGENLDRLDNLKKFTEDADAEISGRGAASKRMADHAALAAKAPAAEAEDAEAEDEGDGGDAEGEDDEEMADKKGNYASKTPRVGDVAKNAPKPDNDVPNSNPNGNIEIFGKLYAAGNVDGFSAGQELNGIDDLAKALLNKVKTFSTLGSLRTVSEPVYYPVATLTRDYPKELSVYGLDTDDEVLKNVIDEKRLPGGNLRNSIALKKAQIEAADDGRDAMVAATGWCAPSETDYSTCFQGSVDGLFDAPEVQARRGGIRHNQGIDFTGVFGGGTGFFNLSEAQVIAGTTKSCVEIPCPSFVDDRLGVTGLCITGNILQNRGYPEFVRTWTQAAMVASAHQINSLQIAAVVAGSTAVDLTAAPTFASDGSVTSQLLAAVDMAIVDIKYRLRMQRSATLEVVLPWWVLAQFRADMSRQNGGDAIARQSISDAQITSWFSERKARVQWVYDWQDAFAPADVVGAPGGNAPGAATFITGFPTSVKFLVYPSGTWVRAVNDVITLNMIYDSTKLATNQLTQLFTETGWAMMRMCPLSRVYTVPICPTGSTGDQRAVACS